MVPVAIVRVGIDVGQSVDPTAIAVVELQSRADGDHWVCRFLERLPLGTPYPDVARRLATIVQGVADQANYYGERHHLVRPALHLWVYADATGVGQPVVDLLRAANVPVTPVFFTHGDRRTEADGQIVLGKAWLVSRLKTLFQLERIHLPPQHPDAAAMARELEDYEIRVTEDANDRYGAFKVGSHDDLVTALGLALQIEPPSPTIDRAIARAWSDLPW